MGEEPISRQVVAEVVVEEQVVQGEAVKVVKVGLQVVQGVEEQEQKRHLQIRISN